jgi:hypothetical protein
MLTLELDEPERMQMNEQQRLFGIADLTSRLTHQGINVIHSQYWPDRRSTYFEVGKNDRTTDFVLSDEFLRDLPATREYQSAVEAYAHVVAARVRCGSPNIFYCLCNRAVRIEIRWPIEVAMVQDMVKNWLLLTVTDEGNGSVARCCVDVHRGFGQPSQTVFDDVRNAVNTVRDVIDTRGLLFYPSLAAHPEQYQPVHKDRLKIAPSTRVADAERFIAGKAYLLAFEVPDTPGEIFPADPWDAEYLGVPKKELSQATHRLRAKGLIEIDNTGTFARSSDKMIVAGGPEALGQGRTAAALQVFELSRRSEVQPRAKL